MFGRQTLPPVLPPPPLAPDSGPQQLHSEDETYLAQLVADLGDGKRRDEIAGADVLGKLDGLWKSSHERLAIEWAEKLLGVPEIATDRTAPLRAWLAERYEQRGELDAALPHLEQLVATDRYALRAHYLLAEHARRREDH